METRNKKVLILYTSVGLGHKSIAENIGYHLEQNGFEVQLADVLKVQQGNLVTWATRLHQFIGVYLPFVWKFLYRYGYIFLSAFRVPVASRNHKETKKLIDAFKPDMVISTQTSASAVISYLKKEKLYTGLFAVAFSDYHFHPYWMYDEVDLYLANIPEQKQELLRLGVSESKIFVCGVTLKPKVHTDATAVSSSLSMEEGSQLVLFSSGSLGTQVNEGWLQSVIAELLQNPVVHIAIITGKNKVLFESLSQKIQNPRVHLFSFHNALPDLYQRATMFLTKPGGLTMAETWQYQLPTLITQSLPGQEELNVQYIVKRGLSKLAIESGLPMAPKEIRQIIEKEMSDGDLKKSLSNNPVVLELVQDDPLHSPVVSAIKQAFH